LNDSKWPFFHKLPGSMNKFCTVSASGGLTKAQQDHAHLCIHRRLWGCKRVSDANPSQYLTVVQVFGPEHVTSRFGSGLDDHRVPKTQLGLLLKGDRGQDILGLRREHLPCSELSNSISGFIN
jgi:hypothetical protein